jgi:hypothetical protein
MILFVNKEEIKCERDNCIERKIQFPANKMLNEKIKNKIISRKQKKTYPSRLNKIMKLNYQTSLISNG